MKIDYTCAICRYPSKSTMELSLHLQKIHNKMTIQQYREDILKLPKGTCKMCGKPTAYLSLERGYKTYCSSKCGKNDPERKAEIARSHKEKYGVEYPMQRKEVQALSRQNYKAKTGYDHPGQNPECKAKGQETSLKKYGVNSPNKSDIVKQHKKSSINKKYGVDNVSQLEDVKAKKILTTLKNKGTKFGFDLAMSDPEFRSSVIAKGKFPIMEKKINEFLTNRGFEFKHNFNIGEKCFDFVIFKESKPVLAIESDGIYYHGLKCDYDGIKVKQHQVRDYERFAILPNDCKLLVIDDETKFEFVATEIMRIINMEYEIWIKDIINSLPIDFPFPSYTKERIYKDYEKLCTYDSIKGQSLGMSAILQFHKNIWKSKVKGYVSPYDAWQDPVLLEKCVRNRTIYKSVLSSQNIARGFAISKIAPKVSVFNPSIARYLLKKYSPEAKIVCDPFSGFSGRMLGACSLGMKYNGYDANITHVKESNNIIKFLKLDANISCNNILNTSIISGDVCLTCPPYNLKETWGDAIENYSCDEWIKIILEKVQCKKYIIVVDKTEDFKDNIAEELTSKSHFTSISEKVIYTEK